MRTEKDSGEKQEELHTKGGRKRKSDERDKSKQRGIMHKAGEQGQNR